LSSGSCEESSWAKAAPAGKTPPHIASAKTSVSDKLDGRIVEGTVSRVRLREREQLPLREALVLQ